MRYRCWHHQKLTLVPWYQLLFWTEEKKKFLISGDSTSRSIANYQNQCQGKLPRCHWGKTRFRRSRWKSPQFCNFKKFHSVKQVRAINRKTVFYDSADGRLTNRGDEPLDESKNFFSKLRIGNYMKNGTELFFGFSAPMLVVISSLRYQPFIKMHGQFSSRQPSTLSLVGSELWTRRERCCHDDTPQEELKWMRTACRPSIQTKWRACNFNFRLWSIFVFESICGMYEVYVFPRLN